MQSLPDNKQAFMDSDVFHLFLVKADSADLAQEQVRHFMDGTQLVSYRDYSIATTRVLDAADPSFRQAAEKAIAANRAFTRRMLADLQAGGVQRLEDLADLEQGYLSKTLHVLTHMLDGFIGIDSRFYNLVEDSHWLSSRLWDEIGQAPGQFWLIPVRPGAVTATLLHP